MTHAIQRSPCKSCPYRKDVPSGVWHASEYGKLIPYDKDTFEQPMRVFMCHQQDGSLCRGWLDCHGDQLLALRLGLSMGTLDADAVNNALCEGPATPVFASGQEAASHGLAQVQRPTKKARAVIDTLFRRKQRART